VHRILHAAGLLAEAKRRKAQHRRRRKRYAQEGMLVQIDGSRHAWLGEGGPWLTLIAGIDDATGKITAAVFRKPGGCSWLLSAGTAYGAAPQLSAGPLP
jgi:hypothetical protein